MVSGTTVGVARPNAPTDLSAESARDSNLEGTGNLGANLLWNAPSGPDGLTIDGYRIQVSTDGGTTYTDVEDDTGTVTIGTGADAVDVARTYFTHESEPATDEVRMYRVATLDDDATTEQSAWSNVVTFPAQMHTHNMAPTRVGTIDDMTVMEGQTSEAMDVSMYFSDAEGDTLTYEAMSDMEMYATAEVYGSMLTITGVAAGMATITVTATDADGSGMSAMQEIMVTVSDTPPATTAPMGAAHSVLRNSITVQWDPDSAQNTTLIKVALFNEDVTSLAKIDEPVESFNLDAAAGDPGTHTFNNVPAGTYKVVVAAVDSEGKHVVSVVPDAVTIN